MAQETRKARKPNTMLIVGGGVGVVLLLVLLMRRKGSSSSSEPTYTTAPSSLPASGEVGAAELAQYESALTAQLPQAIAQGVEAGLKSQTPGTQQQSLPELLGALGTFIGSVQQNRTGEQVGAQASSPSTPAPSVTYNVAPPAVSPPPAAPEAAASGGGAAASSWPLSLGPHQTLPISSYPLVNSVGGDPRKGRHYRDVTYQGHQAHEYYGTVSGGLGPHQDIVLL